MKSFKSITVSLIAAFAFCATATAMAKKAAKSPNLVEVAIAVNSEGPYAGLFSTVIGLVAADAEILEALTSKGQRTVFAPINPAFDQLFADAAANCVDLTPELVNAVLKYHVAKGRRDADAVLESDRIRTLLGAFFAQDGGVITDGADADTNIIVTNVPASNGIIHAIDGVLLPFELPDLCED